MRLDMLNKLHESHLGVTKCRALAETSVWWPNISSQIEDMVRQCNVCAKLRPNVKEPLLPSSFPEHPWSRVAMDLFDLHGKTYLLLVDYHSRWPEIRLLDRLSSAAVIARLKSIFATHGIPDVLVSDNGPQFASTEFRKFTEEFCFTHTTSSPRYPQANGEAERAVQTIKNLLRKASDPYVTLLSYRATPLRNGYAPSELLMGRRLNTKLPSTRTSLYKSPFPPGKGRKVQGTTEVRVQQTSFSKASVRAATWRLRFHQGPEATRLCFDPSSKSTPLLCKVCDSMTWKHPSSPVTKKFKVQRSAAKVMATVFWDAKGVILLDILPQGQCINAARYCSTLGPLKKQFVAKDLGS
ncbi:Pol polyprotein [Plakobranchus ocellatus]|uniref:Pol polyprotein n=1 Tax=Plakobranchus ocellatus TaxID=259542 RepID=A0AAV4DS41_9GAST|nr:Pol polyprotein [Plakobranchus ocellatus]